MQVDAEAPFHFGGQFVPWDRRTLVASFGQELHYLQRALAGLFWATLARQQAVNPLIHKGPLQKIEQLTADAEGSGHLGDGVSIDPMSPQHLVADLDQVARIEECRTGKERIAHMRGMGMQGVAGLEELELGVRAFGHS
jgi:hypothetical protein